MQEQITKLIGEYNRKLLNLRVEIAIAKESKIDYIEGIYKGKEIAYKKVITELEKMLQV